MAQMEVTGQGLLCVSLASQRPTANQLSQYCIEVGCLGAMAEVSGMGPPGSLWPSLL